MLSEKLPLIRGQIFLFGGDYVMTGYREERRNSDNEPIHTEKIFADRKVFFLDLKENERGRFVKITEDVRGRRDTIMIPAEVLDDFVEALKNVQTAASS
jgi:PurA ssDNA and RNA-binding protein